MSVLTHSTTSKTTWDFDPRSIPGCEIWFDAADDTTLTTSVSTIKAWRNKGSIDTYAIEDVVGSNGGAMQAITSNGIAVNIPAGSQLAFTATQASSTSRSWFIVAACQTQLPISSFWAIVNQTAGSGQESLQWT